MKKCNTCFETKQFTDFSVKSSYKDGYRNECKKCRSVKESERYYTNPEKAKTNSRKRLYGVTEADYTKMLDAQKGVCAVCHRTDNSKALSVDHCHKTGVVRGLLCTSCNLSLGHMQDCPDRLRQAALYLERFLA